MVVRFAYLRDDDDANREPPYRRYEGDPAWDLALSSPVPEHFYPKTRRHLYTNLTVAIPNGYVGLLTARASTFQNRTIVIPPQWIYPNYRGEIMIEVHNPGNKDVVFLPGERIAQLVILPAVNVEWQEVQGEKAEANQEGRIIKAAKPADLGKTDRGDKCMGSTGRGRG